MPKNPFMIMIKRDHSRLGLSDLPPELRNIIFREALTPPRGEPIHLNGRKASYRGIAINLLATCWDIRKTVTPMLFGGSDFRINVLRSGEYELSHLNPRRHYLFGDSEEWETASNIPRLHAALNCIPSNHVAMIRTVSFAYHSRKPKSVVGDRLPFPDRADAIVEVRLLPIAPFYEMTINEERSKEARPRRMKYFHAVSRVHFQDMFAVRQLRRITKNNLVQLASAVQFAGMMSGIGI